MTIIVANIYPALPVSQVWWQGLQVLFQFRLYRGGFSKASIVKMGKLRLKDSAWRPKVTQPI